MDKEIALIELGLDLEKVKERNGKFAVVEYIGTWDDEAHYWYYWYDLNNLDDVDLEHLKFLCDHPQFRGFAY